MSEEKSKIAWKGMRHVALFVTNMSRARVFYEGVMGLKLVWSPDADNVYLSSGTDNIALHSIAQEKLSEYNQAKAQFLDHFGFIVESPQQVEEIYQVMEKAGVNIVAKPRKHRDGSHSFYMTDPDGNKIQILYEPNISPQKI